jgi:hypothetical protein
LIRESTIEYSGTKDRAVITSIKDRLFGYESAVTAMKNRLLQLVARIAPGATSLRVTLHRWRGVKIGKRVYIGLHSDTRF